MDTLEARTEMRDLARDALEIVGHLRSGVPATRDEKQRLRRMLSDAREVLPDAGYPAEQVWRGIQRAGIGVETSDERPDRAYWEGVGEELRQGLETLEPLVSRAPARERDFHVIG